LLILGGSVKLVTRASVSKATKVLYVIGQKLYENMSDRAAYDNLTTLTRGIVVQIKKLQELVQVEPPNHSNMVITFTNEVIYEHLVAYDAAIKEVSSSLSNYIRNNTDEKDMTVNSISKIISQLEILKNSVRNPDIQSLVAAVASISDSLEKFCASVYHVLHLLGDQNEVIKEQVMETMQQALHGCTQLQLVVVTKGLSHNVVNPENTMLISVRFLLLSVSIIVDAIDYMKQGMLVLEENDNDDVPLGPDEIREAIVYILHYGRPLYRGDDVGQEPEEPIDLPQHGYMEIDVPMTMATTTTTNTINIKAPKNTHNTITDDYDAMSDEGNSPNTTKSTTPLSLSGILPAGAITPAPVVHKSWIDMTTAEFKAYCDANGKPNPDSFTENNLPPNFEKPPPKAVYEGSTREEYKAYMVAKYEYETWENKLVLFKIKLKKKLEEIK